MLDQARRKFAAGNAVYRQAAGEAFRSRMAAPISCSCRWSIIILPTRPQWPGNATAILCRGGHVCVRNGTRESDFPHRHFFPALRALIDSDLPSRRDIQSILAVGGFMSVVHQVVTQVTAPDWQSFIEKSALRADSFLARLSDDDFQGMAALRTPGDAINQNDAVTEEIDWFVFHRD
jgi:hypothetical protein